MPNSLNNEERLTWLEDEVSGIKDRLRRLECPHSNTYFRFFNNDTYNKVCTECEKYLPGIYSKEEVTREEIKEYQQKIRELKKTLPKKEKK